MGITMQRYETAFKLSLLFCLLPLCDGGDMRDMHRVVQIGKERYVVRLGEGSWGSAGDKPEGLEEGEGEEEIPIEDGGEDDTNEDGEEGAPSEDGEEDAPSEDGEEDAPPGESEEDAPTGESEEDSPTE